MGRHAGRRVAPHRLWAALLALLTAAVLGLTSGSADAHPRPPENHPLGYVALGDSYAAGEGLPPFEAGTEGPGQCHRSVSSSYPALLAEGTERGERAFAEAVSVACSGAISADLLVARPGSATPPQQAALSPATRTVTLTIGGNDAGFSLIFDDCVYSPDPQLGAVLRGRPGCAGRRDAAVSARIAALSGAPGAPTDAAIVPLPTILTAIENRAPRATVYLTGYPRIFGKRGSKIDGCRVSETAPLYVSRADTRWIRSKAADLNRVIKGAAARARADGVDARYVDVARSFRGHNLCDAGPAWLNGVVLAPTTPPQVSVASFHPTLRGQQAYAAAVRHTAR